MRNLAAAAGRGDRAGMALVLAAALAFGVLRALTVPAGLWNIDEAHHYVDVLNTARYLPYEIGRALGASGPAPAALDGGTIDPAEIFHPTGWLPLRGTTYLLLQAAPQILLEGAPPFARLFVARLVSVLLHLAVITLTYAITRHLVPAGAARLAPLGSAILAAFVPSYSDMMSGVNVDAGAAAAGAVYLAALARLLRAGPRPGNLALLALAAGLGLSVKETFWPLLPATAAAGLWVLAGWRWRLAGGAALAALAVVASAWLQPFTAGGAAHWFDAEWEFGQDAALAERVQTTAPAGQFALRLTYEDSPDGILQYIPERRLARLDGLTLTWGVWLRADRAAAAEVALVNGETAIASSPVAIGPAWEFYSFSHTFDEAPEHLALRIRPRAEGAAVEVDGAVVAAGEARPAGEAPVYWDENAARGEWGGHAFENLLLNASGEANWPQVIDAYNVRPRNLNTRLNALFAWQRTLTAFFGLGRWLLANFWSGFGGLLPGLSARQMIPFAALSAWAGLGAATVVLPELTARRGAGRPAPARVYLLAVAAAALAAWLVVLYRSDFVPNTANVIVWSVSRHASAGLAATAALLAIGLLRWLPQPAHRWALAALALALFATNAWILLGVQAPVYACRLPLPTDCLPTVHSP